jgi:diguanylate cyclase (GGDEF)-like protein
MMDGNFPPEPLRLGDAELARLMPMHLWVDARGMIRTAGPTLAKLWPEPLAGLDFFDVFELRKPRGIAGVGELASLAGHRILLELRGDDTQTLRGIAVGAGAGQGIFVNLSFGLSVAEAVRNHRLSHADFAPTDLTVELLYLSEVKGAVMEELAALNARLGEAQRQAEAQAMTDPLTGLANRRGFERALARMRADAHRGGSFALLHIDLDYFKAVNDTYGHAAGDEILSGVAACIRAELRSQDVTARIGGDEFVVLVAGVKEPEIVQKLADRIIARIEGYAATSDAAARVSASIGAVLSRRDPVPDADALMAEADGALYAAKRAGRARCVVA